jgi:hypothetical protein
MVGGGFGPSTGKLVEVCESPEARFTRATRSVPPVSAILTFAAVFLGVLSGITILHDREMILGAVLLVATAAAVSLLVVLSIRTRE